MRAGSNASKLDWGVKSWRGDGVAPSDSWEPPSPKVSVLLRSRAPMSGSLNCAWARPGTKTPAAKG